MSALAKAGLLALFLGLAFASLKLALANTFLYGTTQALATAPRETPAAHQVQLAREQIQRALALAPKHPDNLELAGRVHYLAALTEDAAATRQQLLQTAMDFHTQALQQRPGWAYSHVNAAYAKSELGEFDAEYQRHFAAALRLGGYDRQVLRDLTYLGINDWSRAEDATRTLIVEATSTVLKHRIISPRALRPYLQSRGQLYRICARLPQFEEKLELCN